MTFVVIFSLFQYNFLIFYDNFTPLSLTTTLQQLYKIPLFIKSFVYFTSQMGR